MEKDEVYAMLVEHELIDVQKQIIDDVLPNFNNVKEASTIQALIDFQSVNKYLLMAAHQKNQKRLGKLVANPPSTSFSSIIDQYDVLLMETMVSPLTRNSIVNALSHMFGYFKEHLDKAEKQIFIEQLEAYKNGEDLFELLLQTLYSWSEIYQEIYLQNQSLFNIFLSEKEL